MSVKIANPSQRELKMNEHREISFLRLNRRLLALTLLGALPAISNAGISNGAFNGNLVPWVGAGNFGWLPIAGNGCASLGVGGSITQNNWHCGTDLIDDPLETCTVTFRYQTVGMGANQNGLEVTFGDTGAAGTVTNYQATNVNGNWVNVTITSIGCTFKDLKFKNIAINGAVHIDDVVDVCDPVPEPTTFAALGVGALSFLKRRRRTR